MIPDSITVAFCECGWRSYHTDSPLTHEVLRSRRHLPDGRVSVGVPCPGPVSLVTYDRRAEGQA